MLIDAIKLSLENMGRKFTDLSKLEFNKIDRTYREKLIEQKVQERPFAYEFYHQFRKMWDSGSVLSIVSDDVVIQAEVNKRYQEIPELGKMPDFLLHKPGKTDKNFAVLEFKLASNYNQLEDDFKKLFKFRQELDYKFLIEVVIGEYSQLRSAIHHINELKSSNGEDIVIICFDTKIWKSNDFKIKYNMGNVV